MEVKGKVKVVGDEVQVSATYTKRELVVTTYEQYPQHIAIEFSQGKCNNELDQLKVGEDVSISINLGGREWVNPQGETRYFNSIKGWRVVSNMGTHTSNHPQAQQPQSTAPSSDAVPNIPNTSNNGEEHDDLPFK